MRDGNNVRIEYQPLAKLQSAKARRNPKRHEQPAITASFDRFGFVSPIIVDDRTGQLVAGHGRLEALEQAKAAGERPPERIREIGDEWYVPVIHGIEFDSDFEAEAYLLADNQTTQLGGWYQADLLAILNEHAKRADGLQGTGFAAQDITTLLTTINQRQSLRALHEDEVTVEKCRELQATWQTLCGQMWQAGPHRLWIGDSQAVPSALFAGQKIRMVWTDPPFGVDYARKNARLNRVDGGKRVSRAIQNDDLPPERLAELFCGALNAVIPYCEPGASCYAAVPPGRMLPVFIDAFDRSGFRFHWQLVWIKNGFVLGRSDYHLRHENLLFGWLENGPHLWAGDRSQDSVFEVDRPAASDLHSVMKPIELVGRMLRNSSLPGDAVYDPFAGSGTTLIAAHQLGRVGLGVEIDPCFAAVILERLAAFGLRPELLN